MDFPTAPAAPYDFPFPPTLSPEAPYNFLLRTPVTSYAYDASAIPFKSPATASNPLADATVHPNVYTIM